MNSGGIPALRRSRPCHRRRSRRQRGGLAACPAPASPCPCKRRGRQSRPRRFDSGPRFQFNPA